MIALVIIICLSLFSAVYFVYLRKIANIYQLDCEAKTPAIIVNDGVDYIPTNNWYHHARYFSAIYAGTRITADPVVLLRIALVTLALCLIYLTMRDNLKLISN